MSSWNFRSPKYTLSFCFSHNSSLDHHHNQDFLESGEYFVISYPFTQFLLCSEPFASVNLNPTLIQLSKDGEFNLKSEVFSHFHLNFTDHQPLYLSDTYLCRLKYLYMHVYILRHFWTQTCIFLFLIVSSRTPGQRAWEGEAGAEGSRGHQSPLRTSPAPQTSRFSFHCFVVNLFSFLAKLTIYNRRLLQVSHKGSTANFYDIFSGIKVF